MKKVRIAFNPYLFSYLEYRGLLADRIFLSEVLAIALL